MPPMRWIQPHAVASNSNTQLGVTTYDVVVEDAGQAGHEVEAAREGQHGAGERRVPDRPAARLLGHVHLCSLDEASLRARDIRTHRP